MSTSSSSSSSSSSAAAAAAPVSGDSKENNNGRPRFFDKKAKNTCWASANVISGRHPDRWRKDATGNIVCKRFCNCSGCLCFEYDHIVPFSKGVERIGRNHLTVFLNKLLEFGMKTLVFSNKVEVFLQSNQLTGNSRLYKRETHGSFWWAIAPNSAHLGRKMCTVAVSYIALCQKPYSYPYIAELNLLRFFHSSIFLFFCSVQSMGILGIE